MSIATLRQEIGGLCPRIRPELRCTRSLLGGKPAYVLRDPITGRVHKLSPEDYQTFCHLNGSDTIEDIFANLEKQGLVDESQEESFYRFVMRLQERGMVTLPLNDGIARYQTLVGKMRAKMDQRLFNFLFLQIPLISPNAFLDRTAVLFRPFFSRGAAVIWTFLMALGAYVVISRFDELAAPLLSLVELQNLPWVFCCLIVLKVVHEFGHAYACKILGGVVPEMGIIMVVLTPLAYVDATSSWSFPRLRDRILVSLAGMYVESVCAVAALVVWAMTGPGLVNTIAYQSFVMASIVTVLFNLNPLMRFDGYYVLSDLLSIPNLRGRSHEVLCSWFDRTFLGLRRPKAEFRLPTRVFLGWFGLASSIYRITLVLSICATIATEFYFIGLGLALLYVGKALLGFIWRSLKHLLFSLETAGAHGRGFLVATLVFVGLPMLGTMHPVALPLSELGIVKMEREAVVRARTPGFLTAVTVLPGETVNDTQMIASLQNNAVEDAHWEAQAKLQLAEIEYESRVYESLEDAAIVEVRQKLLAKVTENTQRDVEDLEIRTPLAGRVLRSLPNAPGSFLQPGDEVALIGSGNWIARVLLDEQGFANLNAAVGDKIECSILSRPGLTITGEILKIGELGSHVVEDVALTSLAGGNIVVNERTREAQSALFEVTVRLRPSFRIDLDRNTGSGIGFDSQVDLDKELRHGMKLLARFEGTSQPLMQHAYRRVLRFTHALRRM